MNPNTVTLLFLFSVTALIISVFSFFYFKSYVKRRTSQERILSELQEEVNSILKSINTVTERDITLILEKEKEVKSFLEEIEKRMKTYLREMDSVRKAEEAYQELGKNRYRINRHPASQAADAEKKIETQKSLEAVAAYPLPDFNLKAEASPLPQVGTPSTGEQIRSMLHLGFPIAVIASRLGVSIAEVEFASALASSATKSATSEN